MIRIVRQFNVGSWEKVMENINRSAFLLSFSFSPISSPSLKL